MEYHTQNHHQHSSAGPHTANLPTIPTMIVGIIIAIMAIPILGLIYLLSKGWYRNTGDKV